MGKILLSMKQNCICENRPPFKVLRVQAGGNGLEINETKWICENRSIFKV